MFAHASLSVRTLWCGAALFSTACSPVAASSDAGDAGPSNGGSIVIKSLSYTGTAAQGSFSFSVESQNNVDVATLTEARVVVGAGEIVFPAQCTRCREADGWCAPHEKAVTGGRIDVVALDTAGSSALGVLCNGVGTRLSATRDSPSAATSDVPTSLTLKGTLANGEKWSATASVN